MMKTKQKLKKMTWQKVSDFCLDRRVDLLNLTSSIFLHSGFRYGKTLVPFLKVDQQSMKLEADKCLSVLCFTQASCVSKVRKICVSIVS